MFEKAREIFKRKLSPEEKEQIIKEIRDIEIKIAEQKENIDRAIKQEVEGPHEQWGQASTEVRGREYEVKSLEHKRDELRKKLDRDD